MPMELPPEFEKKAEEVITHYPPNQRRSAVLPLLHLVQHHHRYIPAEGIEWVAQKLGIAPVDVLGVVTFYPGFRQVAPGRYHIRVCRTLSCAMAGSYELMDAFCQVTRIDRSQADHHHPISVSEDGRFSIEFAECLASCGTGPVCMVEDDFYENVKPVPSAVRAILEKYGSH
jgi:NADH-quinone oxidoreductase subunit E